MILWLLTFCLNSYAVNTPTELRLELGETYAITDRFSKIWIENRKLIAAHAKQKKISIKTIKTGVTHFRLDNRLTKVVISPIGSKKTFSDWTRLAKKFVGLNADYCGSHVCLTGTLYRLTDYQRIIENIRKYNSEIYLSLNVLPEIAPQLQKYIEDSLRRKGLTPLKVQFTDLWKVYYSKTKFKNEYENKVKELGLYLEHLQQTTDIADNIKVAVKVVEITKNFERKLGVRWPDSYQAQVITNSQSDGDSFELSINAAEKAGEAKILASPNLICRSGREADFFAGGEFPIKILGPRSKEIMWKRYGIGLKMKPFIDALGQMSLQIETEVSTLDRSITVDDIPALHTNRVSSFFDLISSRTIAISGLIKSEVSENSEGLPFLKNIPVLGNLFMSKNFQENKSELVIFVTPELMN